MRAILLIDHGSRRVAANETLACMANLVQHLVGDTAIVRYAHMELAEPTIAQGFAQCAESGADEVIAFPYMLAPGRHSTGDIPRLVAAVAVGYPSVSYQVTAAFGVHEHLAAVVLARAGITAVANPPSMECCWAPAGHLGACGDACRALGHVAPSETPTTAGSSAASLP
jgi:sirohydrochlorin ferrochelatase